MTRSYLYRLGGSGKAMTNKEFVAKVKEQCKLHDDPAVRNCTIKTVPQAVMISGFYLSKNVYTKIADRPESKWIRRKS